MVFLGIDIAKNSHVASLIDSDGNILFKAFAFKNSLAGATALINKINEFDLEAFHIGMEATGHYWLSLYSFLIEKQFTVYVINPIQTDGWRKATEIRKRKTDIIILLDLAILSPLPLLIFLVRLQKKFLLIFLLLLILKIFLVLCLRKFSAKFF